MGSQTSAWHRSTTSSRYAEPFSPSGWVNSKSKSAPRSAERFKHSQIADTSAWCCLSSPFQAPSSRSGRQINGRVPNGCTVAAPIRSKNARRGAHGMHSLDRKPMTRVTAQYDRSRSRSRIDPPCRLASDGLSLLGPSRDVGPQRPTARYRNPKCRGSNPWSSTGTSLEATSTAIAASLRVTSSEVNRRTRDETHQDPPETEPVRHEWFDGFFQRTFTPSRSSERVMSGAPPCGCCWLHPKANRDNTTTGGPASTTSMVTTPKATKPAQNRCQLCYGQTLGFGFAFPHRDISNGHRDLHCESGYDHRTPP